MTTYATEPTSVTDPIARLLTEFKLSTAAKDLVPRLQAAGHDDVLPLVCEVLELEEGDRRERRTDRLRRASRLPPGKTLTTLEDKRLPRLLVQQVRDLARGQFLERAVNVLAFGLPGAGKSHAACAIGHALVDAGHSVLFTPAYQLVQDLLVAKRNLELPRALRKLDAYELLILDDIGYVQQSSDEDLRSLHGHRPPMRKAARSSSPSQSWAHWHLECIQVPDK